MPVRAVPDAALPDPVRGIDAHPSAQNGQAGRAERGGKGGLTLLVIEENRAEVRSVPDMLDAAGGYLPEGPVPGVPGMAGGRIRVRTARNLTEAERLLTEDVQCILVDLALSGAAAAPCPESTEAPAPTGADDPDTAPPPPPQDELEMLRRVLRLAPRHAVLVLTDGADHERAAAAVSVGAQDYLFRDELDGRVLTRSIRYAVERKRADLAQQKLAESRLRAQENARLERGLLPVPLLDGSDLRFSSRYRPGRSRALLGGDFYDTVRTADGTVHAMIGDVCGHGPDEAALGVELRIAWRALTFAGLSGDQLLGTLQKVLEHERHSDEVFATLCTVDIARDGRSAGICLAGHPAPLIAGTGSVPRVLVYDEEDPGPALGVVSGVHWPRRTVQLGPVWSLLMYTDGLIEGRIDEDGNRLDQEGLVGLVARRMAEGARGEALLDGTIADVRRLNGGELTDDVAALLLSRG